MIALLPLRGWAGDFMSVQMATSKASSPMASAMPADCPMHALADTASDATSVSSGGMESCSSCELCIPLADLAAASCDIVGFAGHEQPLMGGIEFLSAP